MRKIITAAVAALTLGGAMVATTAPAEARPYGHGGYYHGGGYHGGGYYHGGGRYYGRGVGPGVAIAAGVAGLAVGAALAGPRGYYGGGYGYPGYAYPAYGYGYQTCIGQHWVWDPYYGRNVLVQDRYAC